MNLHLPVCTAQRVPGEPTLLSVDSGFQPRSAVKQLTVCPTSSRQTSDLAVQSRMSAVERKRRIQQALKSLKSARIQLRPVCSKLEGLQQTFQGRESIMDRLESSAADLEQALSKLQAAQEDKDKAVAEMDALKEKV